MMLQALTLIWGCMERKSGGSQKKRRDVFRKFVQKIFVFVQKIIRTCRGFQKKTQMPHSQHTGENAYSS